MNSNNDKAHIVETIETFPFKPNQGYTGQFNIADFTRATTLAGQFRFYRAAKVEYIWEPQYTTYQAGSAAVDVPFLYYVMNRNGTEQPISVQSLQRMGAYPLKFYKNIIKTFKPNTLMGTLSGKQIIEQSAPPTQIVTARANWTFSPTYDIWQSSEILSTTNGVQDIAIAANQVGLGPARYYGIDFICDQDMPASTDEPVGKLTIRVHWEFKEPYTTNNANASTIYNATNVFQNL